jgi:hypothetical protein
MKKYNYILLIISIIAVSGCASTRKYAEANEAGRNVGQATIQELLESGNYFIRVNKLYSSRYHGMDLVPGKNFLSVTNGIANINLAYIGRSFSIRPISAINVKGKIEEISIIPKKRGSTLASMKVIGGGERFDVDIRVSSSGYCSITINNGRLDSISYRGKIGKPS